MQTGVPGVYAIGDCTGRMMLAHAAMAMGETAAENAMGKRSTYSEKICPSCVYMTPEFAGAGSTEEQLKAKNINYKAGVFPIAANGKSVIMEEPEGEVKVLADTRSGKLLGIHILGPRATDLIGEAAAYLNRNAYVEDIAGTMHAHPTVSEALREAALAFQGKAIHFK
ncbi:MAG: FAD-dependent oxidoreductase, partial [Firmicutes bacterium]|nr:FAD-dependent oxidoreductase [Bacillota bacterium]